MSGENLFITFHEVDFIVPTHRFHIQYSYVTQRGLPFIREFVLRLVHLAPMFPKQIADYFGLTKHEVVEAISDLAGRDELIYLDSGQITLSTKAKGYFESLGSIPKVSQMFESGVTLNFELVDLNCVSSPKYKVDWKNGLKINAATMHIANSEMLIEKEFQRQFYDLIEKNYLGRIEESATGGGASIYKMDLVKKIFESPFKFEQIFSLDAYGVQKERDDVLQWSNTSNIETGITNSIHKARKVNNLSDVNAIQSQIEEQLTSSIVTIHGFDIHGFVTANANSAEEPFYLGPVYLTHNWDRISKSFGLIFKELSKRRPNELPQLKWIIPSDGFWGKSSRIKNCLSFFSENQLTKGDKPQRIYEFKVFAPVANDRDKTTINAWKQDLLMVLSQVAAIREGFLFGHVELIVLPDYIAYVGYHLSIPEKYDVSVPVGFVTKDKQLIRRIDNLLGDYLRGSAGYEQPNLIGEIAKL